MFILNKLIKLWEYRFHHELIGYGIFVLISLICLWTMNNKAREKKKKITHQLTAPEPVGARPFIGHLHLLKQHQRPYRALGALADEYGPAFCIRLGANRAFVVSNSEVVKECFTINDKVLSSRPTNLATTILGYGDLSIGFAPYGQHWREMRKMAVTQVLSAHRLELCKHIRETEINSLLQGLYKKCEDEGGSALVELKDKFWNLTMNIILRSIAGNRFEGADDAETRRCKKTFDDFHRMLGQFFISDSIPILGWIDWISGSVGEVKRTVKQLDYFLGKWVEEHRQNKLAGEIDGTKQDFIDVMLSAMDDGRPAEEVDAIIKAQCMSLIGAGSDTTTVTLTWAISLLLNNNHTLKKAQDELDICVGKRRQVEESDINNLTYIKAIIKETLRLYPAAPLSVPRIAMEDCTVAGFHIPKGAQLMVNLWKLHRDPTIWKNPLEFIPERFLEEHAQLNGIGQDFEYLPFGSGRRTCPGMTFGTQVIHLALARLLHAFEFRSVSDSPIDMTEAEGLTLLKDTPLEVMLTPRLLATFNVN